MFKSLCVLKILLLQPKHQNSPKSIFISLIATYMLLYASMHVAIANWSLRIQACWQLYARTDCGLICFVYEAVGLRCKNTGYFNGATHFIPGINITELSSPFCWYQKEIMNRPLRLKHNEHCETCTGDNRQLTSDLVKLQLRTVGYKIHKQFLASFSCYQTVVSLSIVCNS